MTKKQIILDGLGWGKLPEHEISSSLNSKKLFHLSHLDENISADIYIARKKKLIMAQLVITFGNYLSKIRINAK